MTDGGAISSPQEKPCVNVRPVAVDAAGGSPAATSTVSSCVGTYVQGYRRGRRCPYQASVIINLLPGAILPVCGYHARQYVPAVQYPIWANLAQLRRLQMDNLDRMESANEAVASYE